MRRVGLVACVKKKLAQRAAARDFYASPLFRLSRAYVERHCDEWAVLSAKHGLVLPDEEIDPYDETLLGKPKHALEAWGEHAWHQISGRWPPEATTFVFLGGQTYSHAVVRAPNVERPLARLGIGKRLAFLAKATKESA